jgi:hypothetical protein
MRVSRYQPTTVEPIAPRRCRFNPVVSEREYIPSEQLQETIDAARLRAQLKRPSKPAIRHVERPAIRVVATPASTGPTPMTIALSITGIVLLAAFVASNPIGMVCGVFLLLAAIANHARTDSHPIARRTTVVNLFDVAVNNNYRTKHAVLDLRTIHVARLPDYLHEFYHLDYILVNQASAKHLKRKHGRIKIIVVSDNQ